MVTIIGSVQPRDDNSLDPSQPRRFTVDSSVYDASKTGPVHFSVACFMENTKRWQKVKTPPPGALLSVTAKVAGRTTDTNHLALRVLDLAYLPRPASTVAPPTPTATPSSKRSGRWEGRAAPSTPSKRPRLSDPANEAVNPSGRDAAPPVPTRDALNIPQSEHETESLSVSASPSTAADPEQSSHTSLLSLTSDSEARPHRNRHPPRKYTDLE